MKKLISLAFIMILLTVSAHAQEQTAGDYFDAAGTKLGRGLENIATSPAEIPCTVEEEMHKGDRILRFFSGAGLGTVYFLRRVLIGATETVTFFIPMERTIPRVCSEAPAEPAAEDVR